MADAVNLSLRLLTASHQRLARSDELIGQSVHRVLDETGYTVCRKSTVQPRYIEPLRRRILEGSAPSLPGLCGPLTAAGSRRFVRVMGQPLKPSP
jgi:hypothetical protein